MIHREEAETLAGAWLQTRSPTLSCLQCMYVCMYVCVCMYVYIYIERERKKLREREVKRERERERYCKHESVGLLFLSQTPTSVSAYSLCITVSVYSFYTPPRPDLNQVKGRQSQLGRTAHKLPRMTYSWSRCQQGSSCLRSSSHADCDPWWPPVTTGT